MGAPQHVVSVGHRTPSCSSPPSTPRRGSGHGGWSQEERLQVWEKKLQEQWEQVINGNIKNR